MVSCIYVFEISYRSFIRSLGEERANGSVCDCNTSAEPVRLAKISHAVSRRSRVTWPATDDALRKLP
jgi:hypothetical protein